MEKDKRHRLIGKIFYDEGRSLAALSWDLERDIADLVEAATTKGREIDTNLEYVLETVEKICKWYKENS